MIFEIFDFLPPKNKISIFQKYIPLLTHGLESSAQIVQISTPVIRFSHPRWNPCRNFPLQGHLSGKRLTLTWYEVTKDSWEKWTPPRRSPNPGRDGGIPQPPAAAYCPAGSRRPPVSRWTTSTRPGVRRALGIGDDVWRGQKEGSVEPPTSLSTNCEVRSRPPPPPQL